VYISLACDNSIDLRISRALQRKENALAAFQSRVDVYRKERMKQRAIDLVKSL
jgi:hypothetical protein